MASISLFPVSILVVLECALEGTPPRQENQFSHVSILVVLECALEERRSDEGAEELHRVSILVVLECALEV